MACGEGLQLPEENVSPSLTDVSFNASARAANVLLPFREQTAWRSSQGMGGSQRRAVVAQVHNLALPLNT